MKFLKTLSLFFFFFIPPLVFAQPFPTLNCDYIAFCLTNLPLIHVSVTEEQMKQHAQEEALAIVEKLSLKPEQTISAQEMIKAAPTYKTMCETLTFIYTASKTDENEKDHLLFYKNFLDGTLHRMDPHSAFHTSEDFQKLWDDLNGTNFKGLGISYKTLGKEDHGPFKIQYIFPDSDTLLRGLQVDDLIIKVNERPTSELSILEFQDIIHTHSGSFSLTIERADQTLEITGIGAKELLFPRVQAHFINSSGLIYIKISSFSQHLRGEVLEALSRLRETKHTGILLDLRGNTGGSLYAAIALADAFIDEGLVTQTKDRTQNSMPHEAYRPGEEESCPLVILIDQGSASASELFTAALQDHGRAVVVGRPSYGKGTIQSFWHLGTFSPYGGHIRYTTGFYYRPTGLPIQLVGVTPDFEIKNPKLEEIYEKARQENPEAIFYEKEYKNALSTEPLRVSFQPTYQFREIAKQKLRSFIPRQELTELEQKDLEQTQAIDILKFLTGTPLKPNHFGKAYYYPAPYHRLHINCDLWSEVSAQENFFGIEFKFRDGDENEEIYHTAAFLVGQELTLSLNKTPLQTYVEEHEHGSFFLDITVYQQHKTTKKIQTYTHHTIVEF